MLESLRPNNHQDRNTALPIRNRLSKVILSSQPPQNTPLEMALPIRRKRPNFTHENTSTSPSHQETCTSPWINLIHEGEIPKARGTIILQLLERRPQAQKVRQNEMTENMLQTKEQDKNPQGQLKEEEIGNPPEKEFRIMIVKMIQNHRNRMDKIQKFV